MDYLSLRQMLTYILGLAIRSCHTHCSAERHNSLTFFTVAQPMTDFCFIAPQAKYTMKTSYKPNLTNLCVSVFKLTKLKKVYFYFIH